uniref:wiskott-Aldrich syndrome protein homolog 1 isoform X2 n=1 Tax=Erigeron canadensis TaxID=72917 RepID=UPI001CB8FEEE|nr:wiskott-Aldrich syndrome protein homolog 1 isoform X2 [Erigeron canadensis]
MGKGEEHTLPTTLTTVDSQSNVVNHHASAAAAAHNCVGRIGGLFKFKCVFVLILGLSVLISAVFWLPPFFKNGDHGDPDLDDYQYKGHDIVATFMVQKPSYLLQDDLPQLGRDIFDEIRVPTTKVVILTAEETGNLNTTKVIFSVDPNEHNSKISSYAKTLVRDSFVSLVLHQSPLSLTESLFGEPSSFEVLKFVGGITVTPVQKAYPLQKVQIQFTFTLNFSVQQILDHFGELTSQLKSGLHLGPYENLHVSLTNPKGSTVAPPTTVQALVVLVIGTPSTARSKQLAQTIKGTQTDNLGLNNTQFGKVKQVRLSTLFNSSSGGATPTPSPAPLLDPPQPHHNHHHHHHHHDKQLPSAKAPLPHTPALPPVPTPAPHNFHNAKPPEYQPRYKRKRKNANRHLPLYPPVSQPALSPHTPPVRNLPSPPPPRLPPPPPSRPPSPPPSLPPPPPSSRPPPPPFLQPPPPVAEAIPASSPLPNVVFAHTRPPSKSDSDADSPDMTPPGSISQPSSCAGAPLRAFPAFLVVILLHLLQQ